MTYKLENGINFCKMVKLNMYNVVQWLPTWGPEIPGGGGGGRRVILRG